MVMLEMMMHGQKDGEVHIEVSHEGPGSAVVVIDRDNVPALLRTVLNALRVGNYPEDVKMASAMSCAAMLSPRLSVNR